MSVTFKNFRSEIDATILDRGEAYYHQQVVQEIEEVKDKEWRATVFGSDDYIVNILELANGTLIMRCTCPYDWGEVCKHKAATLFAIEADSIQPKKTRKKRQTRADRIRIGLTALSQEELVELLVEVANKDKHIAHLLLTRYSQPSLKKSDSARLVRDALKLGKQHGFIDYRGSRQVAAALEPLLTQAQQQFDQGNYEVALPICQAIVEELVPAFNYIDDSSGSLGGRVASATMLIEDITQMASGDIRLKLFDYLLSVTSQPNMLDWDWGWDLLASAGNIVIGAKGDSAEYTNLRQKYFAGLDKLPAEDSNGWSSQFSQDRVANLKLSIIQQEDDPQSVLTFLESQSDSYNFVKKLAKWHLDQKNLKEAHRICAGWLAKDDGRYAGVTHRFRDLLIDIVREQEAYEELAELLELQFAEFGDFHHYDELKILRSAEWPTIVQRLIKKARRDVEEIYVREEMWHELLTSVQRQNSSISRYHSHLANRFPNEVCDIYINLAEQTMNRKKDRGGYKIAIQHLKQLDALGQKGRMAAVASDWRIRYKQRSALLDEMRKAGM